MNEEEAQRGKDISIQLFAYLDELLEPYHLEGLETAGLYDNLGRLFKGVARGLRKELRTEQKKELTSIRNRLRRLE